MTTTKRATTRKATEGGQPSPADLETARRIHTLAQMVYAELSTAHPWIGPRAALGAFEQATWMPSPMSPMGSGATGPAGWAHPAGPAW